MKAFITLWVVLIAFEGVSQTGREDFERAKQNQSRRFVDFRVANDSAFVQFIRESWRQFDMMEPHKPKLNNKPPELPVFQAEAILDEYLWHMEQDTGVIMRSFTPEVLETPDYFPETATVSVNFYGAELAIRYPVSLFQATVSGSGSASLIDFWLKAGKAGYQVVIEDLLQAKQDLRLPDYGFYVLIREVTKKLVEMPELRPYYEWFLLNKTGFACKLGQAKGVPVLLIGANGKIYNRSYFEENGLYYYATTSIEGNLFTYGNSNTNVLKPLDLTIIEGIDLPLKPFSKRVSFEYDGRLLEMELWYNQHVTDLLVEFPQTDIRFALHSSANPLITKSLHKALDPQLDQLNDAQKAKFLLAFVQSSFEYQSDQQQFGREKIMYPDEFMRFQFSDCDDRVVWLAFLLREFTNLEIVAVLFPRHVALAVHLPPAAYGESILFNGRKFIFCDPTYFNAPLGSVIPEADKKAGRIIEIRRE